MKVNFSKMVRLVLLLGFVITTNHIYFIEASSLATLQIHLVYPQESNAPKRHAGEMDEPQILKGDVFIDITGIKVEQISHPKLYVEYFLDDDLIYTTEDKPKPASSGFTLDTLLYPDGSHNLVVNLWDEDGPSAIGIRKIIIQNQDLNED